MHRRRGVPPSILMAMLPVALLWRDLSPGMRVGVVFGAAWIAFAVWNSARVARASRPALEDLEQAADDAADARREYARRFDNAPAGSTPSPRTDPARTSRPSAPAPAPGQALAATPRTGEPPALRLRS